MCHTACVKRCHGCPAGLLRREFFKQAGAAAACGMLAAGASARGAPATKARVAVFFLSDPKPVENWPWPGWDPQPREKELATLLTRECPGVEFEFFSSHSNTVVAGLEAKDRFDGAIAYLLTLGGSGAQLGRLVEWNKPLVLANYVLGGCAPFLTWTTRLAAGNKPVVSVSTERDADLAAVARVFAAVNRDKLTAEQFAQQARAAYRKTFGPADTQPVLADALSVPSISEVLKRLAQSRIVIVNTKKPTGPTTAFGAQLIHVDFAEFNALCDQVDKEAAEAKAAAWMKAAESLTDARPEAIFNSARVALATRKLLEKYNAETVTMNCLGGFAAGKLPAYPCLGFTELLDEGRHGVCEAQVPDSLAMVISRALTGRSGFVSDPTLDTSTNRIIYAHCMAPTKMLGTERAASRFRIRTLHNRDPRGACVQSFMPEGYLTTSFRIAGANLLVHQAKAVGNYDSERGCRSQLVGAVVGDIEKLMRHWYTWHRVTVYGDVKEPLKELAAALKLNYLEEA